jgi:hypothetical protein
MSDQEFHGTSSRSTRGGEGATDWATRTTKETFASASTLAGEAAEKVKEVASDTAATLTDEVKQMLDRQVGGGADMLGFVARSAKRAADDLERDSPKMAGLVRSVAGRMDGYAHELRDQSVDQLIGKASDFTRRQPALVFGLAALAGFFAVRTVKSAPSISAPSIQPSHSEFSGRGSQFHGS